MEITQRLRAMLAFAQAADQGSFAAAARALDISPAAVSKSVAGLEAALGVRLMNRTTRSLTLTGEGSAFLARVREALSALDSAVDAIAAQRAAPIGRVRLSVGSSFGRRYLMPLLPAFRACYPQVRLEIDFDDRHVDIVRQGYDLALRGGTAEDSALVSRVICRFSTVLVASTDYLARHGAPRSIAELARHERITARFLSSGVSNWRFATDKGEAHDLAPDGVLTLSDPEAVLDAAVLGLGIAQVGVHHAWPHLTAGRLKVVLYDRHQPTEREFSLQYPHRALLAPRVRATTEFLLERLRDNESLNVGRQRLAAFSS